MFQGVSDGTGDQIDEKDEVLHDEIIKKIAEEPRDVSALGVDLNVLTISNVASIAKNFDCTICMSTARNPVVVKHCLHFFCKECLEQSMRQL